jgi:uncharacterized CHY-type Zn-finger protein
MKMSEIKTICMMCKRELSAVEEFLELAVCLPCKRRYWPSKIDKIWERCGWW